MIISVHTSKARKGAFTIHVNSPFLGVITAYGDLRHAEITISLVSYTFSKKGMGHFLKEDAVVTHVGKSSSSGPPPFLPLPLTPLTCHAYCVSQTALLKWLEGQGQSRIPRDSVLRGCQNHSFIQQRPWKFR